MPSYTASFTITLRVPMETSATALPVLVWTPPTPFPMTKASVTPVIAAGKLAHLRCEVVYDGGDLEHICFAGAEPPAGIQVLSISAGMFMPPRDVAPLIRGILYHLSGMTLQADVYQPLLHDLEASVGEFRWHMPDGSVVPPIALGYPSYGLFTLRDSGRRAMSQDDWIRVQEMLDGKNEGAPLWMSILAEAHRERRNDIRNVTLRCATAFDVGMAPFLLTLADDVKPLRVLRGEMGVQTPDLRMSNGALYADISRLWYTRHSIIHRGKAEVFDKNPQSGAAPIGPLTKEDTERFLCAVPKAIEYVTKYPP